MKKIFNVMTNSYINNIKITFVLWIAPVQTDVTARDTATNVLQMQRESV